MYITEVLFSKSRFLSSNISKSFFNPPTTKLYYAFFHDVFRLQTILLPSNLTGLVVVGLMLFHFINFLNFIWSISIRTPHTCSFRNEIGRRTLNRRRKACRHHWWSFEFVFGNELAMFSRAHWVCFACMCLNCSFRNEKRYDSVDELFFTQFESIKIFWKLFSWSVLWKIAKYIFFKRLDR